MPHNRRTHQNRLSMAALTLIILVCTGLAGVFVTFVVSRNRLAALAEQQRQVEHQIALYHQEIQALEKRIDTTLTRDKVHERLTAAGTRLQPIEPKHIFAIPTLPQSSVSQPSPALVQNQPPERSER